MQERKKGCWPGKWPKESPRHDVWSDSCGIRSNMSIGEARAVAQGKKAVCSLLFLLKQNADFGIMWCFEYLVAIELSLSWQYLSEMAMYQSAHLSLHVSICLSFDLSTYLSIYLSIYRSLLRRRTNPPPTKNKPRKGEKWREGPWQTGEQLRLLAKLKGQSLQAYVRATDRVLNPTKTWKNHEKIQRYRKQKLMTHIAALTRPSNWARGFKRVHGGASQRYVAQADPGSWSSKVRISHILILQDDLAGFSGPFLESKPEPKMSEPQL